MAELIGKSYQDIRQMAAHQLRENQEDYKAFMIDETTGDAMTDELYDEYCRKVEETAEWGGELEVWIKVSR